jgi:hypothetical protein
MSELRSVVEQLRAESLPELPDARIEEDFADLHQAIELLEVERLRRLAEIDRRRIFERDGHLSAASWLATRFKVAWGRRGDRSGSREDSTRCRQRGPRSNEATYRCQP